MPSLASELEQVFEKHYAEVIAQKDARIAELEARLAQIASLSHVEVSMSVDDVVKIVEATKGMPLAATPRPLSDDVVKPPIEIHKQGAAKVISPINGETADLVYIADNEQALDILTRWVSGDGKAPSQMHDLLDELGFKDEAEVLRGKNNGRGLNQDNAVDPNMIVCQKMAHEAVFYMRNGNQQMVKDRLVKLFGKF